MATKFREGSAGAADQKTVRGFKIAMTLATVLAIILLWTVPLLKQEAAQTGGFLKVISWALFAGCFLLIAFEEKITEASKSATTWGVLWFLFWGGAFFLRIAGGV